MCNGTEQPLLPRAYTGTGKCLKTLLHLSAASSTRFLSYLLRNRPTLCHFSHGSAWKTTPPPTLPPHPFSQCCTPCPWTFIASLWRRHQSQADESVQPSVFLSDTRRRRTHSLFSAFISCVLGVKCDISPHVPSPLRPRPHLYLLVYSCMKFPYWSVKLSFMVKLLSFSR